MERMAHLGELELAGMGRQARRGGGLHQGARGDTVSERQTNR